MTEQSQKPGRPGEPASKPGRPITEILQLNQELVHNLEGLVAEHDARKKELDELKFSYDQSQAEMKRLHEELAHANQRDAERHEQLRQLELDELQNAQLQWAMDRQALLDQHDALKQGHQDLQQSHDRAQVELGRLKDDVGRAKARDEERRGQLRQLEQERMQLGQKFENDQKKMRTDLKSAQEDLDSLQSAQIQWAMDRETLLKDRDAAVAKQAELEQEWQKARADLTQEKARLTDLNA